MKMLSVILLLATAAGAQTVPNVPLSETEMPVLPILQESKLTKFEWPWEAASVFYAGFAFSPFVSSEAPNNAREYALDVFRRKRDYEEKRMALINERLKKQGRETWNFTRQGPNYTFIGIDGRHQSFRIDDDSGKVEYENLSPEDALLMVVAFHAESQLTEIREYDRQKDQELEERESKPPVHMSVAGVKWAIVPKPTKAMKGTLGQTDCTLKKVLIDKNDSEKRDTVMHELMHVATGCYLGQNEHAFIFRTTPGLLKLLQDNPDLADYLLKRVDRRDP